MESRKIKEITVHALLIAIMAIMAFTPLGYIKIGVVQMTLMCIPLIAGIFFGGKKSGLLLGFVFGLTSFVQCFGSDVFGTTLFSINPFYTVILCFLTRMAVGFAVGLIYDLMKSYGVKSVASYTVISFLTPILNTLLFVGTFILLFRNSEYFISLQSTFGTTNLLAFAAAFCGLNALLEVILCGVVGVPLCKALERTRR